MIKKHLITCSVLLLLILLTKVFFSSKHTNNVKTLPTNVDFSKYEEPVKKKVKRILSFANEKIPVHDPKVALRCKKIIEAHTYQNLQTNNLHHQAAKWFPVIVPILKKYQIPEDFKYMPLVESGLKHGVSSRGAAGYWQFMPQTARDYGLTVNGDVDERLNMRKSTEAACKYLRSLYSEFHDWALVAAAYNIGETRLWKQIDLQKRHNYFKMHFNHETATYVYKLISMKEIIEHPKKYGYTSAHKVLLASYETPRAYIKPKVQKSSLASFQLSGMN